MVGRERPNPFIYIFLLIGTKHTNDIISTLFKKEKRQHTCKVHQFSEVQSTKLYHIL